MLRVFILTVVSYYLFVLSTAAKLPSSWKVCKRSDKNLNECLVPALHHAVQTLKHGNPSLGVLPIDPLHFEELNIGQGSGPVSISLNFKNTDIYGISSVKIEKIRADWDKYDLEADATFAAPITIGGDYSVKGQILLLPITGNGKCNLTFDNFAAKLHVKGHEITKGKEKHMEVDTFSVDLSTTKLTIYLGNLFNGDKLLGDNMNTFLNENWEEILKELKPAIVKALDEAFKDMANNVFKRIPIYQIAPK